MRLDFTILWIDDQQKHVQSFSEGLRMKLRDKGFDLDVIAVESLDKVEGAVGGSHVHDDTIDLVLVDYDLGVSGAGGEQALARVRKQFPFKEIVFYSATDIEKLRKIAFDTKVDGVYFSTRLSLVNDTTQVIEKLLSKVLDLDHMRGIVMSASSDIDFLVEHSLLAVHDRLPEEGKSELHRQLVEKIEEKLDKWRTELHKAKEKNDIKSILKLRHLYTAHDRLGSLLEELKGWAADGSTYLETVAKYRDDVVPRRNKLAHAMLKREKGKVPTLVGGEQNWTIDDMTSLRCELIEHRENFQNIAVLVDVRF